MKISKQMKQAIDNYFREYGKMVNGKAFTRDIDPDSIPDKN